MTILEGGGIVPSPIDKRRVAPVYESPLCLGIQIGFFLFLRKYEEKKF